MSIEFLPERLNRSPVVFRGLTSGELFLAFGCGAMIGLVLGILLIMVTGIWPLIPTAVLLCGFLTVFFSGRLLASRKRGRASMWFYRALQMRLTTSPFMPFFEAFGLADRRLIQLENHWAVRRK
ncbi:TIGR03750 family conjugal transfer protein [Pseudomonas sp. PA15(2017)]|uniref:TIGR03750 family conjugal transfer protein n=1 Tax=Pseudomonas sp. PA15(2017) TaxID=1932111 RepID=UPI001C489E1F|nr:TIGR03750 family conjugal transfer protein [Pseudomonas sp. PA15(2017)]